MDEAYQSYVEQVARLTQPTVYPTQLKNIQESPKFQWDEQGKVKPRSFPGYSVITPPYQDDTTNSEFYEHLAETQQRLLNKLPEDWLLPVPARSFHVTLADLIWGDAFERIIEQNPQFESQLKYQIATSFEDFQNHNFTCKPLQWQLLGFIIRPRAIIVALLPKDETSYQQVIQLRRCIYQNQGLLSLGLEQHYYFLAHVTLGYFAREIQESEQDEVCNILTTINDQWLEADPKILTIERAELRRFSDMTSFIREPDFPVVTFSQKES